MHAFGLVVTALLALGAGPAIAYAAGPYYATPSWDQTLPASTRFIVLSNFNSEAVLDRETGLVWERNASSRPGFVGTGNWQSAFDYCRNQKTGNRIGWRVPRLEEFASLVDASTSDLPVGHPFVFTYTFFWTSTTYAPLPGQAWAFKPGLSGNFLAGDKTTGNDVSFWCVRGGVGLETE
jgi:hypothetical protein